jgi:hypothetical protein
VLILPSWEEAAHLTSERLERWRGRIQARFGIDPFSNPLVTDMLTTEWWKVLIRDTHHRKLGEGHLVVRHRSPGAVAFGSSGAESDRRPHFTPTAPGTEHELRAGHLCRRPVGNPFELHQRNALVVCAAHAPCAMRVNATFGAHKTHFASFYYSHACDAARIAILQVMVGSALPSLLMLGHRLAVAYASRHRHDLHLLTRALVNDTGRSAHWQKIPASRILLSLGAANSQGTLEASYDHVVWLDLDALVINMEVSLRSMVAHASRMATLIVSGDTLVVNTGVVIWRSARSSIELLDRLWAIHPTYRLHDNGALAIALAGCTPADSFRQWAACYNRMDRGDLVNASLRAGDPAALEALGVAPEWRDRVHLVPQRMMNSRLGGTSLERYEPGDFILHVAGGPRGKRRGLLSAVHTLLDSWKEGSRETPGGELEAGAIIRATLSSRAEDLKDETQRPWWAFGLG